MLGKLTLITKFNRNRLKFRIERKKQETSEQSPVLKLSSFFRNLYYIEKHI